MDKYPEPNRGSLPAGTVTFLFTDIEGSTQLASHYPNQVSALLERHHAILQQAILEYQGYVFQIIGDAFCAAFHTAENALCAALAAQRSLQNEAWEPAKIEVRMGIHTGAAQAVDRDDRSGGYQGYLTLACVQGIMSSAHGGQVILSGASAELVRGQLPDDVTLQDMGEHRLKGGVVKERLWQLISPDLRSEFPPLKTLSVFPNNFPVQTTSFVGRERELAQVRGMFTAAHLLTLIGPGGTGKTRLSLQLAAEILPEYADGIWLIELAPISDPALVLQAIAATLEVRENPGIVLLDQVTGYLNGKQLLMVLDNCEHMVETCAYLVNHFISHCPTLKVIASSREALGITGETIFRVPPLNLPEAEQSTLERVQNSEAVQLFVDRARAIKSNFTLTRHNAPAVAQICRRMDGIPLALELAAARVGLLTPEQIAARLDDRFRLLTGGSRTALPRQQTLRSMIDWSFDLLPVEERTLFCQLSVFVGGWSLEAAEAMCPEANVMELLAQLVNKSLVAVDDQDEINGTRFRMLETIRQYARDRLLETGTIAQIRDRHLEYYMKYAEAGETKFTGPERLEWVVSCELEHDNFRAALQWGLDHNILAALRLGAALPMFWATRGFSTEGRGWLKAALDRAAQIPRGDGEEDRQMLAARAKGLTGYSQTFYGMGDYQGALDAGLEATGLYRELGSRFELAYGLGIVGNMAAFQNDPDLAERALTEAVQIGRELNSSLVLCFALGVLSHYVLLPRGNIAAARSTIEESIRHAKVIQMPWAVAQGDMVLGHITAILGQWDKARQYALKAAAIFEATRDSGTVIMAYNLLADIEIHLGNLDEARRILNECLVSGQKTGLQAFVSQSLEGLAYLARAEELPIRTARLLGAAEAVREGLGTSVISIHRLVNEYEQTTAWLHEQLDEPEYERYWREGCGMSQAEAVAYALEKDE